MNTELGQPDLGRLLTALAEEHRAAKAPLRVERAVLAEFDVARRHRVGRRLALVGALAASLAAGVLLVRERPATHSPTSSAVASHAPAPAATEPTRVKTFAQTRRPRKVHASRRAEPVVSEAPFLAIPYTVPLGPGERATVVRMTLSASAMAAIGFPLPAMDPSLEAQADVLVGEDGRARAIRLVGSE